MTSADQILQKAKSLVKQGKKEEAEDLLHKLLVKFPANERAKAILYAISKTQAQSVHPPQDQVNTLVALYTAGAYEDLINQTEKLSQKFSHSCEIGRAHV